MSFDSAKPFHEDRQEWTDERVATLRELHAKGYSASQIAKRLGGCTRNAVIGKINRLGILRYRRVNASPLQVQGRVDGRSQRVTRRNPIPKKPKAKLEILPTAAEASVSAIALNVSLMDLEAGMCRWPTGVDGKHVFCGRAWEGEHGPYCKEHHVLGHVTYVKKPRRIRPPRERWDGEWREFGMWVGKAA